MVHRADYVTQPDRHLVPVAQIVPIRTKRHASIEGEHGISVVSVAKLQFGVLVASDDERRALLPPTSSTWAT